MGGRVCSKCSYAAIHISIVEYSTLSNSRWDAMCAAADSRCAEVEQAAAESELSIY